MTQLIKTIIPGFLFLLLTLPSFSSNIAIIESVSVHEFQKMDKAWKDIAELNGHNATILAQTTLDDLSNLDNYDLLIIASGLIDIPANRQEVVRLFIEGGKNAYIQAEFSVDHPGNSTFSYVVNNLGGSFQWLGEESGGIGSMTILNPFNDYVNITNSLDFYWYGTYGTGDETIQPILENNGLYWGFIFNSNNPTHGKVVTTSDQDWIRISFNDALLENILAFLTTEESLSQPTITIEMADQNGCLGQLYQFTAIVENTATEVILQWQINGVPVAGATGLTFETMDLLSGDVVECVLSLSNDPTYESISNPLMIDEIVWLQDPSLEVVADETSFCENAAMSFSTITSDIEDALNIRYQWTINGQEINGETGANFITGGLNAFDQINCILIYDTNCTTDNKIEADAISINIETAVTPTISINSNTTSICQGANVSFSASGINWGSNPTFEWQIDGQTVGDNTALFSTTELLEGQIVSCVLSSSVNCVTSNAVNAQAASISVTPAANPTIAITASETNVCAGTPITFEATGNEWGDTPQLNWMIDGLPVTGANTTSFTSTTLTNGQNVSCSVVSNAACSSANEIASEEISIDVIDGDIPSINIEADNNQVCTGTNITFTATGLFWGAQPSFRWLVDGQEVGTNSAFFSSSDLLDGQAIQCIVSSSAVCLQVTEANSNIVMSNIGSMTVEVAELVHESCQLANGLVEISTNGGIAPFQFEWSNGSTDSYLSDLPAGVYEVLVSDATGCTATLSINITAEDSPSIDAFEIVQPVCSNDRGSANVVMTNAANYTYQWLDKRKFILSKEASVDRLTEGVYTLNVTNEFGCSTQQTFEIRPESSLNVTTSGQHDIVLGEETRLQTAVNTNAEVTFEWLPAEGLSCTDCENPKVNPTTSTTYTLIVTNEFGCSVESTVFVRVIPNNEVYVPNAFSPNGDGYNDYFTAFGGSHVAQINSLKVVDRWGSVLYSEENLPVNNEGRGWDGVSNGKVLKTGLYIYVMEVQFTDGNTEILQGDITLIQ